MVTTILSGLLLLAAEYRSWLLFYSLPCMKGVLSEELFSHYALLVGGIYLLSQKSISAADLKKAEILLAHFVEMLHVYYGMIGDLSLCAKKFLVKNLRGNLIDLMHNDVKQCFCSSKVHCGSCSHAQIQYGVVFPEAGNLNGSNVGMTVLMWLGRHLAARAICLSFQIDHRSRTFTIFPTASTYGRHLGFEHDYNYHTTFRTCYVIIKL